MRLTERRRPDGQPTDGQPRNALDLGRTHSERVDRPFLSLARVEWRLDRTNRFAARPREWIQALLAPASDSGHSDVDGDVDGNGNGTGLDSGAPSPRGAGPVRRKPRPI